MTDAHAGAEAIRIEFALKSWSLNPKPETRNPKPETLVIRIKFAPKSWPLDPKSQTPNPKS